jgi:hypothetical protein
MRPLNLTVWKCRRGNSNKKSSKSLTLTSWQRLVGGLGTGSLMNEGWKSALSQDFMHWDRAVAVSHCDCRNFFSSPQWGRTHYALTVEATKPVVTPRLVWQTDSVVADKHSNAALTHCFALPPWLAWTSLAGLSAVNGCSTWPTPPAFFLATFNFHCYF